MVCYEHVCKAIQPQIWLKWSCENLWKNTLWENIHSYVALETSEVRIGVWRAAMNMESQEMEKSQGRNCTSRDERWELQQKTDEGNGAGERCPVTVDGFVASSPNWSMKHKLAWSGVEKNQSEDFTCDCETIESSKTPWNTAPFTLIGGWVSTQLCAGNFIFSFLCVGDKAI